jgi:hypothetical protein
MFFVTIGSEERGREEVFYSSNLKLDCSGCKNRFYDTFRQTETQRESAKLGESSKEMIIH